MARIIPAAISDELRRDPKRASEVRVYDALSRLKGDWLVMYSLSYLGRHKTNENLVDGEIDFLVARPDLGFLVLEVKGGDPIEREGHSWYSYSQSYNRYEIKDPFKQAMTSKHLLLKALKNEPQLEELTSSSYFCHGVCFPDISEVKGSQQFHERDELMILSGDLDTIQGAIENIFEFSKGYWISRPESVKNLMNELIQRYSSHTIARRSGRELAVSDGKKVLKLTEQQYFILKFLQNQKQAGIQGCPGSGKTLLALEKARLAVAEGKKTLLLCFNKPLGDYLLEEVGLQDNLLSGTFHSVMLSILIKQVGMGSDDAVKVFFDDDLLLETVMDHDVPKYETIIVDEAQDFSVEKLNALQLMLPDHGEFYLFYDRGQNLTGTEFRLPQGIQEFPLYTNHRNSKRVGEYLKHWIPDTFELDPNVPEGLPVKVLEPYEEGAADQLSKRLASTIRELHREGFEYSDITVITLGSSKGSSLEAFNMPGVPISRFGRLEEGDKVGLTLDSVKRYKGLESPIVIITETESEKWGSEDFSLKMASAVSRAVTQVMILPSTRHYDYFLETVKEQKGTVKMQ